MEVEATVILNSDSKAILTDLTSSDNNVNSSNAIAIEEYDTSGSTAQLTYTSSGNVVFSVSDVSADKGKITFKLKAYCEGVTIA